jgi:hypothetical protein
MYIIADENAVEKGDGIAKLDALRHSPTILCTICTFISDHAIKDLIKALILSRL